MPDDLIFLDNHSTTPCDRRVAEAVLDVLVNDFANASSQHAMGHAARQLVQRATETIAMTLGVTPAEVVHTSGATESNMLAIHGVCLHPRQRRRKVVTAVTEHAAVLEPMQRLAAHGFDVITVPVHPQDSPDVGHVDPDLLLAAIDDQTALVSIMWANNEIGTLQPLQMIADRCHAVGALLHCDATQAVGRLPVDLQQVDIDLLSASAHKFYGPKGVGVLIIRQSARRVRLRPLIEGGGQQHGRRGGTLNVAGIVGMAKAFEIATESMDQARRRERTLRDHLWLRLRDAIPNVSCNGQPLESSYRLEGNLNVCFPGVDGEALMLAAANVACSSGAACSSADPKPSHVLLAIGRSEAEARSSLRFGVGRMNTIDQIDLAADRIMAAYQQVRQLG